MPFMPPASHSSITRQERTETKNEVYGYDRCISFSDRAIILFADQRDDQTGYEGESMILFTLPDRDDGYVSYRDYTRLMLTKQVYDSEVRT